MTNKEFRKWRRSLEITQQAVADYVGCSKSTICRWERDEFNLLPEFYQLVMKYVTENSGSERT